MDTRWVIGLASGSSADGMDAAVVEITGTGLNAGVRLLQAVHQPFPGEVRDSIRRVSNQTSEPRETALLHRLLGEASAAAAATVAAQAGVSLRKVFCVGCPGHTVWHEVDGRFPSTLALGMPAVVAERLGVTVVSDFRTRDLVAGGQGVPLAALTDYLLFRHPTESRALLHLGGLAHVVYLPANCRLHEVVGFEAAPCNILLDALMRQLTGERELFDPGGKHAVQGRCLEPMLAEWLGHPCLVRRPPKALPRGLFGETFATDAARRTRQLGGTLFDLLCTATHFVARAIGTSLKRFLPPGRGIHRVLLSGGGVRNGLLLHLLGQQFPNSQLERTDAVGVPARFRKALSFGMLAALTLDGVATNVPAATGAAGSRLLGSITPGSAANWARCLAWMAALAPPEAMAA
jgi:anhydro-N-acetylmuramic acid kinase